MKSKLLVENWRSFLKESQEKDEVYTKQYDVGLVPMSAKPFHAGHMFLIKKAADQCKDVIVFVSISDRVRKGEITIFGEDMKYIWENILEDSIKEKYPNVKFEYGGSPVGKVYKKLEDANIIRSGDVYSVYSDAEDTMKNYSHSARVKYFEDLYNSGEVVFPAEESPESFMRGEGSPNVSGKLMRSYLSNASEDKFLFLDSLPDIIKSEDKEKIFNILFSRLN